MVVGVPMEKGTKLLLRALENIDVNFLPCDLHPVGELLHEDVEAAVALPPVVAGAVVKHRGIRCSRGWVATAPQRWQAREIWSAHLDSVLLRDVGQDDLVTAGLDVVTDHAPVTWIPAAVVLDVESDRDGDVSQVILERLSVLLCRGLPADINVGRDVHVYGACISKVGMQYGVTPGAFGCFDDAEAEAFGGDSVAADGVLVVGDIYPEDRRDLLRFRFSNRMRGRFSWPLRTDEDCLHRVESARSWW